MLTGWMSCCCGRWQSRGVMNTSADQGWLTSSVLVCCFACEWLATIIQLGHPCIFHKIVKSRVQEDWDRLCKTISLLLGQGAWCWQSSPCEVLMEHVGGRVPEGGPGRCLTRRTSVIPEHFRSPWGPQTGPWLVQGRSLRSRATEPLVHGQLPQIGSNTLLINPLLRFLSNFSFLFRFKENLHFSRNVSSLLPSCQISCPFNLTLKPSFLISTIQ